MHHPEVAQSPIFNDCPKVNIDRYTRPQIFPKSLLQVSVQKLHKSLVSDSVDGGLKETIYAENNIIISDSTIRSLLYPN